MSANFRELLSVATDTVDRPRAIADGHYLGRIANYEFGVSRQKQTPYVRFILVPEEETEDVDSDANVGLTLNTRELRKDFFITPNALYRLSDCLDAVLGKESGRSFDERIPEMRDARVMFAVGHRQAEGSDDVYNEIGTIVKA